MADFTLALLKTELTTDPEGLGFAPHITAERMGELAALLNLLRTAIQVSRGVIDTHEIFEATVDTEWDVLSAAEKQRYEGILSMGTINVDGANVASAFAKMFGALTTTRANLVALRTRDGSRAEQLFVPGIGISSSQCADALRLL